MELNAKDIIQAMECCYTDDNNCLNCPYMNDYDSCVGLSKNALALIEQLTEENNRLRGERDAYAILKGEIATRNCELQHENEELGKYCIELEGEVKQCVATKADILRDMQDRLAQYIGTYTDKSFVYVSAMFKLIDRIANEILEGEG